MELIKIVGVGIATTICYVLVKQVKSEFAIFVALSGSIIMLVMIVGQVSGVVEYFNEIMQKTGINTTVYYTILKIIGVGYLTEFASNLCSDAGTSGIGNKIMLGGKIIILCLSLPIITALIDIIIDILP
jgi:stage III sporulation protein AD